MAASVNSKILKTVSKTNLNLNGIFVAVTTPFNENDDICFEKLKHNLNRYEHIPFQGYLLSGSCGEAPYLSPKERVSLIEFVRKYTNKIIIGGSTAESTKATCALTTEIMNAGADAVLVMPPFYFKSKMTEEAIITHYTTIADTCNAPIIIYNNSNVTGIDINKSVITKLAQHPNIRGMKDSDIRKCACTVQDTKGSDFDYLISSVGFLLGGLVNGSSGGIVGLAAVLGNEVCKLYDCYKSGLMAEAIDIQKRLAKIDSMFALTDMGVPGLKAAMDMVGLAGGHCRKPMLPLTEADKVKIKKNLVEGGFLIEIVMH